MKKIFKWIFILLILGFVIIQFFRIDKSVPEFDGNGDFLAIYKPNENVSTLIKSACYDCHSYESKYPWYAEIAPVSWMVGDHIKEGREELNFSIWASYSIEEQNHKLNESIKEIKKGKMPDPSYVTMHSDAALNKGDQQSLIDLFQVSMHTVCISPN